MPYFYICLTVKPHFLQKQFGEVFSIYTKEVQQESCNLLAKSDDWLLDCKTPVIV